MKIGNLVEGPPSVAIGLGVIVDLNGPSIHHPCQIATVRFSDGTEVELVTTVLRCVG